MKFKKTIAIMAVVLTLAASAPAAFAATESELTSSPTVSLEDSKSEENILMETNFETNETVEIVVPENVDGRFATPPSMPEIPSTWKPVGDDTRYELSSYIPAICYVKAYYTQGYTNGTGFIVGSHTVVTAAHVISYKGQTPIKVEVYPAKRDSQNPYGIFSTTKAAVPKKWSENLHPDYDYGIITVNADICAAVGGAKFGYRVMSDSALDGESVTITGYPSQHLYQQWTQKDTIRYPKEKRLYYAIDTSDGQSGSPIYANGYWAEGIHTRSWSASQGLESYNSGVRITQEVYNSIKLYDK